MKWLKIDGIIWPFSQSKMKLSDIPRKSVGVVVLFAADRFHPGPLPYGRVIEMVGKSEFSVLEGK